jgi:hypothetical protein
MKYCSKRQRIIFQGKLEGAKPNNLERKKLKNNNNN